MWQLSVITVVLAAGIMAVRSSAAKAADPSVTAVSGKPDFLMGSYSPDDIGYAEREYFISGQAADYKTIDGALPLDGRWNTRPLNKAAYNTRIVVLAPKDPQRFNGTVIVEWLNVSGGTDSPAVWLMSHRHMIRAGYAYVGVSAQKVGVEGGSSVMGPANSLKKTNPQRYAPLHHPGDAYSYDIFSQIGRLARDASRQGVLGGLAGKRFLAVGESQSAMFLTTYINAVDPLAKVYDGFLVHSRLGSVAGLQAELDLGSREGRVSGIRFRDDLRVPVMNYITEGDLVGFPGVTGYHIARQPDGPRLRTWEIAGASHADNYTIAVSFIDSGRAPIEALAAAYAPTKSIMGLPVANPINFGPQQHYTVQATLAHLDRWVGEGTLPPSSPRIELKDNNGRLALDSHGIAMGGIRTPWVDVPTARLSSEGNPGNLMAAIFGTSEQFSDSKLRELYPRGKQDYLRQFSSNLDVSISNGHILPEDRSEIIQIANLLYPYE